ncbi:MAG: hypothetical protein MAG715_00543 [Methanonatronarchaeales archaeon]|nr:hypothetical protein [Methanonatronarchaeales archaeon]
MLSGCMLQVDRADRGAERFLFLLALAALVLILVAATMATAANTSNSTDSNATLDGGENFTDDGSSSNFSDVNVSDGGDGNVSDGSSEEPLQNNVSNNVSVEPSIGRIVSSLVKMQGTELRGEIDDEEFDLEYERDGDAAIQVRVEELRQEERELRQEKHELQAEFRSGDIGREEYVVRHAGIQAEVQSLKRSLAKLRGKGASAQIHAESIEATLGNLSGSATSRLLESLLSTGGKIEVEIEDGSVEIKIERDGETYLERELENGTNRTGGPTISPDEAVNRAIELLGGEWTVKKIELDDGEYELKLLGNGSKAESKIDGYTGTVLELERKQVDEEEDEEEEGAERGFNVTVTPEEAADIALETLGGNWGVEGVELDDGEYDVELFGNGSRAEVKVDAHTGTVLEVDEEGPDDGEEGGESGHDGDSGEDGESHKDDSNSSDDGEGH